MAASTKSLTLFVDESGDPGWPPPGGKSTNKHLVVGGLALDPACENRAQQDLPVLVRKYLGTPPVAGDAYELHFSDLHSRRTEPYRRLTLAQAQAMEDEVFQLLRSVNAIVFATVVDKAKLQAKYVTPHNPKRLGFRALVHRYDMTLQTLQAFGTVVMDEEHHRRDAELRQMVAKARSAGLSLRGAVYQPVHSSTPTRINGVIHFVPSVLVSGVQLADFCVGVIWRAYERADRALFAKLEPLCYRDRARRYEPSLIPK